MEQLQLRLENFEGPLDLLLHLIRQNRMTLTDVRLLTIVDQYLSFVGEIGSEDLDQASEFAEMAARLVLMKSIALLPRMQEESEELEKELIGNLIEYELCKQIASELRARSAGRFLAVRGPLPLPMPVAYERRYDKEELRAAFMGLSGRALRRPEDSVLPLEEIVTAPVVSVSSRVIRILRALRSGALSHVRELFTDKQGRSELVATFLSLLELIRAKRISLAEDGTVIPHEKGK